MIYAQDQQEERRMRRQIRGMWPRRQVGGGSCGENGQEYVARQYLKAKEGPAALYQVI